jgi:hypothetical protein
MKNIKDMTEEELRWYRKWTYMKRRYRDDIAEEWMTFRGFYTDVQQLDVNEQDVMHRKDKNKPFTFDNIAIVPKSDFITEKATKYIYE